MSFFEFRTDEKIKLVMKEESPNFICNLFRFILKLINVKKNLFNCD